MGIGLSFLPLVDALIRGFFFAAGLRSHTVAIDSETTIRCWIPSSLATSLSTTNPGNTHNSNHSMKPPLLLIHGFGPTAQWQWRGQVGPLSHHFDVIVPDLIFFGGSTTLSPCRSESFQAEAMVKLLDSLGLGETKGISVVGTSYGGFVAYHVARLLGPSRVDRVVIASSDLLKKEEDDREFMKRAGVEKIWDLMIPREPEKLRTLIGLAFYHVPKFIPDFVLRDIIQNLYSDKIEEKIELIKGVTLGNKNLFQLTPLIQDVLIIWGEHDQIFPLKKAYEIQKILGEKAKLETIKNTGHLPQTEDSTRFNEILLNFLLSTPKS